MERKFCWLLGAVLTWTGMSLGATLGFLVARVWGSRCVHWFTRPADLATIATFAERHGAMLLAVARGVPVWLKPAYYGWDCIGFPGEHFFWRFSRAIGVGVRICVGR